MYGLISIGFSASFLIWPEILHRANTEDEKVEKLDT